MKLTKKLEFNFQDTTPAEARSQVAEIFADFDAYYSTLIAKETNKGVRDQLQIKRNLLKNCTGINTNAIAKDFSELSKDELEVYEAFTDQDSSVEDLAFRLFNLRNRICESYSMPYFKDMVAIAKDHSVKNGCRFLEVGKFILSSEGVALRETWKTVKDSK